MAFNTPEDPFFTRFEEVIDLTLLPEHFTFLVDDLPHPLGITASNQLQTYLKTQQDWDHNFGLLPGKEGVIIGKMFGVLVVRNQANELGYLSAFSGKLGGSNNHKAFVPPVFDALTDNSFLNEGMRVLTQLNNEIRQLEGIAGLESRIYQLKARRKKHSADLQSRLFDHYQFLNAQGSTKSLRELFHNSSYKNPPSGAGECSAPKLLQYAFKYQMKPLVMAEFWWGQSPKSAYWKHGHFYNPCKEKCAPILAHMLTGING